MKKLLLSALVLISSLAAFSQKRIHVKTVAEKLNEQYCSGLFNTTEGTYFDMLTDPAATSAIGYLNILDWLKGRVAGLEVYTTRLNEPIAYIRRSRAGIYVDEMLVSPDFLNSLPVADIAMIKIIKAPFAGGFNSPGGVIAIYTVGANDESEEE